MHALPPLIGVAPRSRARREGGAAPAEVFEVLNEVVVSRGAHPYLSNIEVRGRLRGRERRSSMGLRRLPACLPPPPSPTPLHPPPPLSCTHPYPGV